MRTPGARERWATLYCFAAEGLVTIEMARQAGIDPVTLRRRARRDAWPKLQNGVWALPGTLITHRLRCLALSYAVGERALIGRRSAAYEHGLVRDEPENVELLIPADRRIRDRPGVAVTHSRSLRRADAREVNGLRLTTAARTVRDLVGVLDDDELLYAAIRARQRGMVTEVALWEQHALMKGAAGRRRLGWVLDEMHGLDSGFEWTVRRGIVDAGLPAPHPQPYELPCPDGHTIDVDIAWPHWRVGVEVAGLAWHNAAQQTTDHLRHNQATVAPGASSTSAGSAGTANASGSWPSCAGRCGWPARRRDRVGLPGAGPGDEASDHEARPVTDRGRPPGEQGEYSTRRD